MYYFHDLKVLFSMLYKDLKELLTNLYDNSKEVFLNTFLYLPKHKLFFFRRMCELVPIAWNDHDYDWESILDYMEFKLNKIRKHISKHQILENSEEVTKEIEKALELMKFARDDLRYYNEYNKPLDEKYGKRIMYTEWETLSAKEEKRNTSRLLSQRDNWTPELDEQIRNAEREAMDKADKRHEQDWNDFWDYLKKNMRKWWD